MKKPIIISTSILLALIAGSIVVLQLQNNTKQADKITISKSTTLSPDDVSKSLQDYENKEIELKGVVIRNASGSYYIMTHESNNPSAIRLDFSKSGIDPEKYNTTVDPASSQTEGPVGTTSAPASATTSSSTEVPTPPSATQQTPKSQKLESTKKFPNQGNTQTTTSDSSTSPEVLLKGKVSKTSTSDSYIIVVKSVKNIK